VGPACDIGAVEGTTPSSVNVASFSYVLPFLANQAGGFSTQLKLQNLGSKPASLSIQYYTNSGAMLASQSVNQSNNACNLIAAVAACSPANPFNAGASGTGVVVSNQPLSILVVQNTATGSTAYTAPAFANANATLVVPLAINNAEGGFETQLNIANVTANTGNVKVTFYDQQGDLLPAATKILALYPHTLQTLDQTAFDSYLPTGFYGWAKVEGGVGLQLVGQVLEQRPSTRFVAFATMQPLISQNTTPTLVAGAIFNQAFGDFVSGANLINPNPNPVQVSLTYYDNLGKAYIVPVFNLVGNAVLPIYHGAKVNASTASQNLGLPVNGLPVGFYGSALVSSSGGALPLVMVVNEASSSASNSAAVRSGTYVASSLSQNNQNDIKGIKNIGLPIVANQGQGYISGLVVVNTGEQTTNASISYYDPAGILVGQSQSFIIPAHASLPIYQGAAGLPENFYGQAVITQTDGAATNNLIAVANVQAADLFFTYNESNG
jgi:hypothetical protein